MPSLVSADDQDDAFNGLTQDELVDAPEVCVTPCQVSSSCMNAVACWRRGCGRASRDLFIYAHCGMCIVC